MKEAYTSDRRNGWFLWLSIAAVLVMGIGIFFYSTFLRQSNAELIEAVPTDALFLFEINDNTEFDNKIGSLQPFFNEAFVMDAFPAFETVYKMLPDGEHDITISGHQDENGMYLLFNTRIEKATFKKLLRALTIDPANYTSFEQCKIYTYGTNYKSLKFVYINHILTISDNIELIKKAIVQHAHPKNLQYDKGFKKLYELSEKNQKQNWLLINNTAYLDYLSNFFTSDIVQDIQKLDTKNSWSAYQIRMSKNELFLSGYITADKDRLKDVSNLSAKSNGVDEWLPFNTYKYYKTEFADFSTCAFTLAADSVLKFDYLLVVQDSLKQTFNPFRNPEQAELYRSNRPNGIYYSNDSLVTISLKNFDSKKYPCFIERHGNYLFAQSEAALEAYQKDVERNGQIKDSRYYQFSKYNVANNNLLEYTYYNLHNGKMLQNALSAKGKSTLTAQRLGILSFSCTGISEDLLAVNIYLHFGE